MFIILKWRIFIGDWRLGLVCWRHAKVSLHTIKAILDSVGLSRPCCVSAPGALDSERLWAQFTQLRTSLHISASERCRTRHDGSPGGKNRGATGENSSGGKFHGFAAWKHCSAASGSNFPYLMF